MIYPLMSESDEELNVRTAMTASLLYTVIIDRGLTKFLSAIFSPVLTKMKKIWTTIVDA